MYSKLMALFLALILSIVSVVSVGAFTCSVKAVDGVTVTLECKEKDGQKLEVGKQVKVSLKKKRKAAEGIPGK